VPPSVDDAHVSGGKLVLCGLSTVAAGTGPCTESVERILPFVRALLCSALGLSREETIGVAAHSPRTPAVATFALMQGSTLVLTVLASCPVSLRAESPSDEVVIETNSFRVSAGVDSRAALRTVTLLVEGRDSDNVDGVTRIYVAIFSRPSRLGSLAAAEVLGVLEVMQELGLKEDGYILGASALRCAPVTRTDDALVEQEWNRIVAESLH
jgi:hypothetical protein